MGRGTTLGPRSCGRTHACAQARIRTHAHTHTHARTRMATRLAPRLTPVYLGLNPKSGPRQPNSRGPETKPLGALVPSPVNRPHGVLVTEPGTS